jgi:hypothetical protein
MAYQETIFFVAVGLGHNVWIIYGKFFYALVHFYEKQENTDNNRRVSIINYRFN